MSTGRTRIGCRLLPPVDEKDLPYVIVRRRISSVNANWISLTVIPNSPNSKVPDCWREIPFSRANTDSQPDAAGLSVWRRRAVHFANRDEVAVAALADFAIRGHRVDA